MLEGNEEPLMEEIPYLGSSDERKSKTKNLEKVAKKTPVEKPVKQQRVLKGSLFKIWCWTYEVIKGDSMQIKQNDINKHTNISVPSIHNAWNDGTTKKSSITCIVAKLPQIVAELVEQKYSRLTFEQAKNLLDNPKITLTAKQRSELVRNLQFSSETIEDLIKNAPMLTEEELDEQIKTVIEF